MTAIRWPRISGTAHRDAAMLAFLEANGVRLRLSADEIATLMVRAPTAGRGRG
jgi:prophage maintenance system killer protein